MECFVHPIFLYYFYFQSQLIISGQRIMSIYTEKKNKWSTFEQKRATCKFAAAAVVVNEVVLFQSNKKKLVEIRLSDITFTHYPNTLTRFLGP